MQRNGNGPSIGWRLHIKTIAAEIGTAVADSRIAKNRQRIDEVIDELRRTRRMRRNAREHEIKVVQVAV
jgi:hypothetical protein